MYKSYKNNRLTDNFYTMLLNEGYINKDTTKDDILKQMDLNRNYNCTDCFDCQDCTECIECINSLSLRYCHSVINSQYLCNRYKIKNDRYFKCFNQKSKPKRKEILLDD